MSFDFDRDAPKLYATGGEFKRSAWDDNSARSPDLRKFRARGARMIVPHWVSDPVFSVLDRARYVLLNDDEIDVEGAVSIAHDILDDIIGKFDSVSLRASAESWLADRDNPEKID